MIEVNCERDISGAISDQPLQVGDVMHFKCAGNWPELVRDKLSLQVQDRYTLKLMDFSMSSPGKASIAVVSYRVGSHKPDATLSDGQSSVQLKNLQFEIQSVINPVNPVTEPYGAFGPLGLAIPTTYWLGLLVVLSTLVLGFGLKALRVYRRKKLIEGLKVHDTAKPPYPQLMAEIRKMQRDFSFFSTEKMAPQEGQRFIFHLNNSFRLYLIRKFRIPTLDWSDKVIVKEFNTKYPQMQKHEGVELGKMLLELSKARAEQEKITYRDCVQLLEKVRGLADKLEQGGARASSRAGAKS